MSDSIEMTPRTVHHLVSQVLRPCGLPTVLPDGCAVKSDRPQLLFTITCCFSFSCKTRGQQRRQLRDDNNSTQTHKRPHTQVHNLTFLVFFHQLLARSGSQTVDGTRSWRTSDSNHSSSSIKHFLFSVWLIHFKAS